MGGDLSICYECDEVHVFDSVKMPKLLKNLSNQDHIVGVKNSMNLRILTSAHFWEIVSVRTEIALCRRLQAFLDIITRVTYLLLPYETGKIMPAVDHAYSFSSAYCF